MVFSRKGSHRLLLRIIHANFSEAHHALQNTFDKEGKRTLTLDLSFR